VVEDEHYFTVRRNGNRRIRAESVVGRRNFFGSNDWSYVIPKSVHHRDRSRDQLIARGRVSRASGTARRKTKWAQPRRIVEFRKLPAPRICCTIDSLAGTGYNAI